MSLRVRLHEAGHSLFRSVGPAMVSALVVLAAYLATLAPTTFGLDSAELTAAAYSLGIVHAPGYPVYLLLAHVFTRLPIGDVGYRANLFSAVAAAAAVGLLVAWLRRSTAGARRDASPPIPAVVAGVSFGLCFYVWSVAVVAEVYTLQGLLLVAILWCLWEWQERGQITCLLAAAGLTGLAFANSPATALWWPGLLVLAWSAVPGRALGRGRLAGAVAAFVLGLLPILYLPLRSAANPAFVYAGHYDAAGVFHRLDLAQLPNLWWYVSGQPFRPLALAYTPGELLMETAHFVHLLWAAFLGIGLPLGAWGWLALWRRHRRQAIGLAAVALPQALFFISYRVADKDTMFLPVLLVWAVCLGHGLGELQRVLPRRAAWVFLVLPIALLIVNTGLVDPKELRTLQQAARDRLLDAEPNGVYLALWGDAAMMHSLQVVEGLRPDVQVVNTFFTSTQATNSIVELALGSGRVVYTTRRLPALSDRYGFKRISNGLRVYPERRRSWIDACEP